MSLCPAAIGQIPNRRLGRGAPQFSLKAYLCFCSRNMPKESRVCSTHAEYVRQCGIILRRSPRVKGQECKGTVFVMPLNPGGTAVSIVPFFGAVFYF